MLNIAAGFLAVAALGGLLMVIEHFLVAKPPSTLLAIGHGILAGTGLVVLGLSAVTQEARAVLWALVFLIFAAALGFILAFGYHYQRATLPTVLVLLHGTMAAVAYAVLLAVLYAR